MPPVGLLGLDPWQWHMGRVGWGQPVFYDGDRDDDDDDDDNDDDDDDDGTWEECGGGNLYDSFSVEPIIWVRRGDESESGEMVLEKVK